jgi:7-cyano-7-deazaguanine synthase
MKRTLVILSGGLDSTTLLYKFLEEADGDTSKVAAISFDYGQRHKAELQKAAATCKKLEIQHVIMDLSGIQQAFAGSALTSDIDVPHGHYEDESMKSTVVPNRNSIFANIAIGYAIAHNFEAIALGIHGGDHAIYPDCRPAWVDALTKLAKVCDYKQIEISTPFLQLSKGEIVKIGLELQVDYTLTMTDYHGKEPADHRSSSSVERILAFVENDAVDPIEYIDGWENAVEYAKSCEAGNL